MSSLVQSMAVPVTEDTPPDLLAGSMDLTVLLPDGRATKTSVQRATPMMDLLVQLCTAHRLSPGGHSLQPLGEKGALPYKPSTPIGLLDAWSVRLLPKGGSTPALQEHPHQLPFQHTFRLQVHLPRNQLLVSRVTPQMGLAAVLKMACDEKNLDVSKYELRHPINLEERLRPELTLGDYRLTEVCVVARDAGGADMVALQREQERRRRRAKQQHGHVAPAPPGTRQPATEVSAITGSVSSGSLGGRSSSPDSTPAAPPPRAPARKRRPAPLPPPSNVDTNSCDKRDPAIVISKVGTKQVMSHHDGPAPTVTHSRTSSDSSGYHEASVLSDGPDTHPGDKTIATREMPPPASNSTLPRRSKLPPATGTTSAAMPKRAGPAVANSMPLSRSVSNLASGVASRMVHGEHSTSTSSLSSTGRGPRKKKAAPPPPPVVVASVGTRAASLDRSAPAAAPPPVRTPADVAAKSQTLPRPAPPAGNSNTQAARRATSIEEEKEVTIPERRQSHETVAKHHEQQQRSSAELPAEKADLYAKLQRRLPSRGDSVTSTSSSGSEDAAASVGRRGPPIASEESADPPAPAVRPSRSRDRDRGELPPQPDVVAVQAQLPPPASLSSKHSSTAPDEDDPAVDEGIGNDDAAEEVARAFASAAAELEAAILAEDLAAAAAAETEELPTLAYSTPDPPCPKSLKAANPPPPLPPSPAATDGEEWHYEIPAPPSAFRDSAETPPPTPWAYADGEVRSKENPLYNSGEFVDSSVALDCGESVQPTAAPEEVADPQQRLLTGAEQQLRNVLDAKARLLLPQTGQIIEDSVGTANANAVAKDADNEAGESSPSDVPDVLEDSSMSQENHSHSLLNHHHAGHLHQHTNNHHHHDHHHHHHNQHSGDIGMPAYLTETIDTLEGFEDLIAVGSGSRPPEGHQIMENTSAGGAESATMEEGRRHSSDVERPVVVGEVVKSSKSSIGTESASVNVVAAKELETNSSSREMTPTEPSGSSEISVDAAVKSGEVSPQRRVSGEVSREADDTNEAKDEDVVAALERQRAAQRRRVTDVGGPLVNFTITTYQREIDPDKIFAEAEDAAGHVSSGPRPSAVASSERRPSQVSRSNSVAGASAGSGSSASSSRRGSHTEQQAGAGLKRSVSSVYAAWEEARTTGAVQSANKEASGSTQLQSLQVLRSILPQLKSSSERVPSSSSSEGSDVATDALAAEPQSEQLSEELRKTTGAAQATEVDAKLQPPEPRPQAQTVVRQPYRPPSVSFASWGERPRGRAVSLKVDSDYRVGGGHTMAQQTSQEPQAAPAAATTKAPTPNDAPPEKKQEPQAVVSGRQNVPVRSSEPAVSKVEPTVIRISTAPASSGVEPRIRAVQLKAQPQRRDTAALTMRIISHTTAAPFVRQGATSVTVNGSTPGGEDRVVPVVRAVELKKSVLQQQQADKSGEVEERFVGVSSLAKRFSFLGDSSVVQRRNSGGNRVVRRPVSELVTASDVVLAETESGGPVHRAGSFTSLVSASRAAGSQAGRSDSSDDTRLAGLVSQNGHVSPTAKQAPVSVSAAPKGFPVPVVKGFRVPGGGAPEPRRSITIVTKHKAGAASSVPAQNPHEQLMAAIRGFGGTGNLRNQTQKIAECES